MNIVLLDSDTLGPGVDLSPLEASGKLTIYNASTYEQAAQRLENAHIALATKTYFDAPTLQNAKNLRLICVFATGYDRVDLAYCKQHGIGVCNIPGYSTHSVAQHTVAMALALCEKLFDYQNYVASGAYCQSGAANRLSPLFYELYGKKWGIVGLGAIGRQVAKVARAFGMEVVAHSRTPKDDIPLVPLEELLQSCDVISLHTPLNEQTRHLIGKKQLALLKPGAILLNTARGAVCDEAAVAQALLAGQDFFFGCDVFSQEPYPADHPFAAIQALPNVLLTPHMAWGALEARQRCVDETQKNIEAFLAGQHRNRVEQ